MSIAFTRQPRAHIVGVLNECEEGSLVVLDELGAGTDPVEGSALARAVLEHLRERRVTTFVATHYSELKAYAHTTPGVINASVEFDAETLAPTFRLTIGLPGRSNAFAIARRLGLSERIIRAAQDMVGPEAKQTEAMLHDIRAQRDAAVRERAAAEAQRAEVEAHLEALSRRMADIDMERRNILDSARADASREIKAVPPGVAPPGPLSRKSLSCPPSCLVVPPPTLSRTSGRR